MKSSTLSFMCRFIIYALSLSATYLYLRAQDVPALMSRSAHERQWMQTNQLGEVLTKFTEIATGLCRWDTTTQSWQDSDPTIDIRAGVDGGIADKASHTLHVASDANAPNSTIEVTMPDGAQIHLQTVGVALTTLDNSDSVFISELQPSIGQKVDATTVIYPNAFTPIKADLRIRNTLAGVESDVILRERVDPTEWGFQVDNCRLEVWTQVLQSPAATVRAEHIPRRRAGDADQDQQIDFPSMSFTRGSAFQLRQQQGQQGPAAQAVSNIRVAKELVHFPDENMTFLIEAIPFGEAADAIQALPINDAHVKPNRDRVRERNRMVAMTTPARRSKPVSLAMRSIKEKRTNDREVALLDRRGGLENPGYVIDFNISGNQSTYTFRGDTTYYATADVNLSGVTTFEGGTVIKEKLGASVIVGGTAVFLSSHFRPAVITGEKDYTVGDSVIVGSQAAPTDYFGVCGLKFQNYTVVSNVVVRHASTAMDFVLGGIVRHAQIVNCGTGIHMSSNVSLLNALIANTSLAAIAGVGINTAQHVTIDIPATCATWSPAQGNGALTFWNSIIYGPGPSSAYIKNSTVDNWPVNPFQTAGAGTHYLNPAIVGARNTGVVTDATGYPDPDLLVELKQMTTEGPQLLSSVITSATTLRQAAARDADTPDLGYHYDPIDYYFSGLGVNSALTVASGVNLAMYGNIGISFSSNGSLVNKGAANNPNRFVHYQMVQEQPTAAGWPTLGTTRGFLSTSGTASKVSFAFCEFSPGGGSSGLCAVTYNGLNCPDFSISHSFLRNVGMNSSYNQVSSSGVLSLTNNCWERCALSLQSSSTLPFYLRMYNNVLWKGVATLNSGYSATPWTITDNLFDCEAMSASDPANARTAACNAFTSSLVAFGVAPKTGITADYQPGPLGRFYYPVTISGANLATLINAGSRTAAAAGLSHFTARADNMKELKDTASSTVDIGFHYIASDEVWIEDSLPVGAAFCCGTDTWAWDTGTFSSGNRAFEASANGSPNWGGQHLWFTMSSSKFAVAVGEKLVFYVYNPPTSPASAIMMQWAGSGNADWSRAYWSATQPGPFTGGTEGTYNQRYMGPLPPPGTWTRMEVAASLLNLEGKTITGFGFTRNVGAGTVIWDRVGKSTMDTDSDGLPDYLEDVSGNAGSMDSGDLSDWQLSDTDGDGVSDLVEISRGADPKVKQADLIVLTPN